MKALHIDGHPQSWFQYKRDGEIERVTYVAFAYGGDDPAELVRHAHKTISEIERMSHENGNGEDPVIFWRKRMHLRFEDRDTMEDITNFADDYEKGRWKVFFRLAAVPQLSHEQWASLEPCSVSAVSKALA